MFCEMQFLLNLANNVCLLSEYKYVWNLELELVVYIEIHFFRHFMNIIIFSFLSLRAQEF